MSIGKTAKQVQAINGTKIKLKDIPGGAIGDVLHTTLSAGATWAAPGIIPVTTIDHNLIQGTAPTPAAATAAGTMRVTGWQTAATSLRLNMLYTNTAGRTYSVGARKV